MMILVNVRYTTTDLVTSHIANINVTGRVMLRYRPATLPAQRPAHPPCLTTPPPTTRTRTRAVRTRACCRARTTHLLVHYRLCLACLRTCRACLPTAPLPRLQLHCDAGFSHACLVTYHVYAACHFTCTPPLTYPVLLICSHHAFILGCSAFHCSVYTALWIFMPGAATCHLLMPCWRRLPVASTTLPTLHRRSVLPLRAWCAVLAYCTQVERCSARAHLCHAPACRLARLL